MTDAEIQDIANKAFAAGELSWAGFDKDENGFYTVPVLSLCHFELVRAVIAAIKEQA